MNPSYRPMSVEILADKPARLTPRQASFYRNLIAMAEELKSNALPVVFELEGRGPVFLDRGCIKMAEHAGFIKTLKNGPDGYLDCIELCFDVRG